MTQKTFIWFVAHLVFVNALRSQDFQPVHYVDQKIGIISGRCYAAAQMPFGLATPGPHYKNMRKYTMTLDSLSGFSHLHANGTGCDEEWGTLFLIPDKGSCKALAKNFAIKNERSEPGYYACTLEPSKIQVQLTASLRTALHTYTFPVGTHHIWFDLSRHLNEKFDQSFIKINNPKSVEGYISEGTFCSPNTSTHKVYFYAEISAPAQKSGVVDSGKILQTSTLNARHCGAWLQFNFTKETQVEVRLGISFTSIQQAKENLRIETNGKSFDDIRQESKTKWNELLGRVAALGGTDTDTKMFYTALYRMLLHPNVYDDASGMSITANPWPAPGTRSTVSGLGFTRYTLFSLWDTYRNLHPYFCLLYPEYQLDMSKSALQIYKERGWLPKWEHHGNEAFNMNGSPASTMLSDAFMRGITQLDTATLFEAIVKEIEYADSNSAERNRPGYEIYKKYGGWIPQEYVMIKPPVWGPVSTTLEYNLADWSFAQVCRKIGKFDLAEKLEKWSKGYKIFFHPQLQLLVPRKADKTWYKPFDPEKFTMFCEECPYVEGNAWNYTFAVPHDVQGLISLFGYPAAFTAQLVKCFESDKFQIGNEPDIHYPYLFNYVKGEEWRTNKYLRKIIQKHFNTSAHGLPGEEDAGTISAWLFGAMAGMYPFCPGLPEYQLSTPLFRKILIKLASGNTVNIETPNLISGHTKIKAIYWNGTPLEKYAIKHENLLQGGTLLFETVE